MVTVSIIMVSVLICVLFPRLPLYVYNIKVKYSPEKTPYAYVTPRTSIYVEKRPLDEAFSKIFKCHELYLYFHEDEKIDIKKVTEDIFFIENKDKWTILIDDSSQDMYSNLKGYNDGDLNSINKILGKNMYKSLYDFDLEVINTTPDSVSIDSSMSEITKATVSLLLKTVLIPTDVNSAYILHTDMFPGILIGDPFGNNGRIIVYLYPEKMKKYQVIIKTCNYGQISDILNRIKYKAGEELNKM